MEDSAFKLPPGVLGSSSEQGGEMSEDEVFSKLKSDPVFLIEVFRAACSSADWLEVNIKHFKSIIKIITDLSKRQGFTPAQKDKINSICENAFSVRKKTSEDDESLMPVESGALNLDNASGFLLWAGLESADELKASDTNLQKCLDLLSLVVLP